MLKCDPILHEFLKENILTLGLLAIFLRNIAKQLKWTWLTVLVEAATGAINKIRGTEKEVENARTKDT